MIECTTSSVGYSTNDKDFVAICLQIDETDRAAHRPAAVKQTQSAEGVLGFVADVHESSAITAWHHRAEHRTT